MLAQLLSSKPKSRLVNLFLAHSGRSFSATELRAVAGMGAKAMSKTLRELVRMGFLLVHVKEKNRYYQIDRHFALYPELVSLLRKIKKVPTDLLAQQAARVGDSRFTVLTGIFAGKPRIETDVLLVGKLKPSSLNKFLKLAEKFAERQVSYTVMTAQEFDYRKIMNDRFLKNILENDPVVVTDRMKNKSLLKLIYKG